MAAYGQQTLGNFHSSPSSLLRNKNMSILLPKMSTLFLRPRKSQSVCLLCGLNQILSERVRYLGVQVQQSGTYMLYQNCIGELFNCVRTKLYSVNIGRLYFVQIKSENRKNSDNFVIPRFAPKTSLLNQLLWLQRDHQA